MKKKSEQQKPEDGETLTDFWLIQGMYTFENVGFTNTVAGDVPVKYMICADCEVGPIGWSSPDDRNNFYIALDRVKHVWWLLFVVQGMLDFIYRDHEILYTW